MRRGMRGGVRFTITTPYPLLKEEGW